MSGKELPCEYSCNLRSINTDIVINIAGMPKIGETISGSGFPINCGGREKENRRLKIVLQRVLQAKVEIEGKIRGHIERGYLLLLGVEADDTTEVADKMMEKISRLRLFQDEDGKTNLNISDVEGEVLIISQFTLCADCRKGNRPSFINAGNPTMAKDIYEYVLQKSATLFKNVECGEFGADMKVSLVNDGPFTIVLDSREVLKQGGFH